MLFLYSFHILGFKTVFMVNGCVMFNYIENIQVLSTFLTLGTEEDTLIFGKCKQR